MRAVRSGASGLDALVVVVAVGAIHQTGGGPGRDEAGDISVLAGGFERMEGLIGGLELQPFVGLGNLARQSRRAAVEAVGVATEAQLEFARDRVGNRAGGIDSFDAGELAGGGSGGGALVPRGRDGVRIVAVGAGGVAGAVRGLLMGSSARLCVAEVCRTGWALGLLNSAVRSRTTTWPLWQAKQFCSSFGRMSSRAFEPALCEV